MDSEKSGFNEAGRNIPLKIGIPSKYFYCYWYRDRVRDGKV